MMATAKAKAKKKRRGEIEKAFSAAEQKKFERRIKHLLDDEDEKADKKFRYVKMILDANPPVITEIVERMADRMGEMAGEPRFRVDGVYVNIDPEILHRINRKLHMWAAVRLLVAGAQWDVRIAGFKLPKKRCARCGKKVKQ